MGIRQAWNRDLIKYIAELEPGIRTAQKKAIIHIGDFNVMAEEKGKLESFIFRLIKLCSLSSIPNRCRTS